MPVTSYGGEAEDLGKLAQIYETLCAGTWEEDGGQCHWGGEELLEGEVLGGRHQG